MESVRKIIFFTTLLVVIGFNVYAQDGNPLQYLSSVSQSLQANPAFHNSSSKLVIGLPLVSGIELEWNANFSPNYIFSQNFSYSFDRFYNALGESGDAITGSTIPVLYLSYTSNKHTFSFLIADRMRLSANFDHDLLKFIDQGLLPYYGEPESTFGPVIMRTLYFREMAFSYANQLTKKLSIGIRPKILFGRFYQDIQNLSFTTKTLDDQNLLQVIPTGSYTISGPLTITTDSKTGKTVVRPDFNSKDYFFQLKNMGAGIDLGFNYAVNNETNISLSITDLAFISFKHNAYNNTYTGALNYEEENLYQSHSPDQPNYYEPKEALLSFSDSLPYITSAMPVIERKYEMLPLKVNLLISYQLSNSTRIGLSNNFSYMENNTDNFLSGFYSARFGNKVEFAANISVYKLEKILPGAGFSYTGKWAQFYLSTNNIFKLMQPSSAKNLNLSFGVNFLFPTRPN